MKLAKPAVLPDGSATQPLMPTWLSVVRVYHLCEAVMAKRLGALDIGIGEHEILINLLATPGLTQQRLAERVFQAKSGVSMLVRRMEKARLLDRRPDQRDARVRRLHLTKSGEALARKAQRIQSEIIVAMAGGSSASELLGVFKVMSRSATQLEALLEEP